MYALAQFPSQGDLIKFTYDALGVIPSKSEQILDLKVENKSFQKSLQRFAKEEGSSFLENFDLHMALLHKAVLKGFFGNIISKWRSLHTKSTAQPIGLHITELSLVVGILPFGSIQKHNGMQNHKANKVEVKPTPT